MDALRVNSGERKRHRRSWEERGGEKRSKTVMLLFYMYMEV